MYRCWVDDPNISKPSYPNPANSKILISNNPDSWFTENGFSNWETFYIRITNVNKSNPPKWCSYYNNSTTCNNIGNFRAFTWSEWLNDNTIQVTWNKNAFPPAVYASYLLYWSTITKIWTFELKDSSNSSYNPTLDTTDSVNSWNDIKLVIRWINKSDELTWCVEIQWSNACLNATYQSLDWTWTESDTVLSISSSSKGWKANTYSVFIKKWNYIKLLWSFIIKDYVSSIVPTCNDPETYYLYFNPDVAAVVPSVYSTWEAHWYALGQSSWKKSCWNSSTSPTVNICNDYKYEWDYYCYNKEQYQYISKNVCFPPWYDKPILWTEHKSDQLYYHKTWNPCNTISYSWKVIWENAEPIDNVQVTFSFISDKVYNMSIFNWTDGKYTYSKEEVQGYSNLKSITFKKDWYVTKTILSNPNWWSTILIKVK